MTNQNNYERVCSYLLMWTMRSSKQ